MIIIIITSNIIVLSPLFEHGLFSLKAWTICILINICFPPFRPFPGLLPYPQVVNFMLSPDPVATQKDSNQFSSGFGRKPFPDQAIKAMRDFLEQVEGEFAGFYFLNWGGAVSRKSPKSIAFYWRKAKYYVEWNSSWTKKSEAAKNIAVVRRTRRKLQPYIVGSYINVPDQGIKNSGPVYYGTNYARLRRVKAKYDPGNVFNNPQSIPPARKA